MTVTALVPLAHALQRFFLFFFQNFFAERPAGEALGKDFFNNFFAECPARSALGKDFFIFFVISLPSVRVRALGKEAIFLFYIHKHSI